MLPNPPDWGEPLYHTPPNPHVTTFRTGDFFPSEIRVVPLRTQDEFQLINPLYEGMDSMAGPMARFIDLDVLNNAGMYSAESRKIKSGEFVFFPVDRPLDLVSAGYPEVGVSLSPYRDKTDSLYVGADLTRHTITSADRPLIVGRQGAHSCLTDMANKSAVKLGVLAKLPFSLQRFHFVQHETGQYTDGLPTVDMKLPRTAPIYPSERGQKARPVIMALLGNIGQSPMHLRPVVQGR
jgi:hypothetical protein